MISRLPLLLLVSLSLNTQPRLGHGAEQPPVPSLPCRAQHQGSSEQPALLAVETRMPQASAHIVRDPDPAAEGWKGLFPLHRARCALGCKLADPAVEHELFSGKRERKRPAGARGRAGS